jgi:hypothetical protein
MPGSGGVISKGRAHRPRAPRPSASREMPVDLKGRAIGLNGHGHRHGGPRLSASTSRLSVARDAPVGLKDQAHRPRGARCRLRAARPSASWDAALATRRAPLAPRGTASDQEGRGCRSQRLRPPASRVPALTLESPGCRRRGRRLLIPTTAAVGHDAHGLGDDARALDLKGGDSPPRARASRTRGTRPSATIGALSATRDAPIEPKTAAGGPKTRRCRSPCTRPSAKRGPRLVPQAPKPRPKPQPRSSSGRTVRHPTTCRTFDSAISSHFRPFHAP